jgi:hypothetical protein
LRLTAEWSAGDAQARLSARPLISEQAASWKSAKVVLDTQTWKPLHIKVVEPSGTFEQIYSFSDWAEVLNEDRLQPSDPGATR